MITFVVGFGLVIFLIAMVIFFRLIEEGLFPLGEDEDDEEVL